MMDRPRAYQFIADALRHCHAMSHDQLRELVGSASSDRCRAADSSEYILDLHFRWVEEAGGPIAIDATIDSAESWRLERLERTIVVHPARSAT